MKHHLVAALAATLALAAIGPARAELKIAGELKVKRDRMVRLRAAGHDKAAAVTWRWDKKKLDGGRSGDRLWLVGPPGEYVVECLAIKLGADGKTEIEEAEVTVSITGDCCPPGAERPPPGPPVPPVIEKPSPKADPVNARARITFGTSGCTATVIHPRRKDGRWDLLTAAHCVRAVGQKGTAVMAGGRKLAVTVTAHAREPDLCWLRTDESADDLPFAVLAKELPPPGARIWHMGYGVDRPGNKETGTYVGPSRYAGMIRVDISMSSGDSGSSFFREDNGESIGTMFGTINRLGHGGDCVTAWKIRPE